MKKIIAVVFVGLLGVGAYVGWNVFGGQVKAPTDKYLFIKTGATYDEVIKDLHEKGIAKSGYFFDKLMNRAKYKSNIKPGRYEIKDNSSLYSLIKMLKAGDQSPVRLVINKLRLKEDLAGKIGKTFEIDSIEAINFLNNKDSLAAYKLDDDKLLSAIIPNTYELNWNSSIKKIFSKLKSEEEKFWNAERTEKAKAKNLTPMQAYIIASIVEEETNKETDRPLVASVYTNRLQRGEKLQADPTVKFAMKDFALNRILFEHLKFPSPYNTYYTVGLPPGPICTPSSKTIDAVLNAPKTNYMFFVAKPDFGGYSNFAETYAQHQVFAKEYQVALVEYLKKKKLKEQQNQIP
jgi:UPF0755 protein